MKKLLTTALLGLLAAGSLALIVPWPVKSLTTESLSFDPFTPEPTYPNPPPPRPGFSESSQEQQVAVSR
jgi:hypothetical protein